MPIIYDFEFKMTMIMVDDRFFFMLIKFVTVDNLKKNIYCLKRKNTKYNTDTLTNGPIFI